MSSALANRAQIAGMLAAEGIDVTIRRYNPGTYDPTTGSTGTAAAPTDFPGRGRLGSYDDKVIDGSRIKVGDRRLTFQPTDWSYRPSSDDVVIVPANLAVIGSIQMRELGGVPWCFTAQVRGTAA